MPTDLIRQGGIAIMPLRKFSYLSGNSFQLLNSIFTQVGEAQTNNFFYGLDGSGFGYNNKLYLAGVSAEADAFKVSVYESFCQHKSNQSKIFDGFLSLGRTLVE